MLFVYNCICTASCFVEHHWRQTLYKIVLLPGYFILFFFNGPSICHLKCGFALNESEMIFHSTALHFQENIDNVSSQFIAFV